MADDSTTSLITPDNSIQSLTDAIKSRAQNIPSLLTKSNTMLDTASKALQDQDETNLNVLTGFKKQFDNAAMQKKDAFDRINTIHSFPGLGILGLVDSDYSEGTQKRRIQAATSLQQDALQGVQFQRDLYNANVEKITRPIETQLKQVQLEKEGMTAAAEGLRGELLGQQAQQTKVENLIKNATASQLQNWLKLGDKSPVPLGIVEDTLKKKQETDLSLSSMRVALEANELNLHQAQRKIFLDRASPEFLEPYVQQAIKDPTKPVQIMDPATGKLAGTFTLPELQTAQHQQLEFRRGLIQETLGRESNVAAGAGAAAEAASTLDGVRAWNDGALPAQFATKQTEWLARLRVTQGNKEMFAQTQMQMRDDLNKTLDDYLKDQPEAVKGSIRQAVKSGGLFDNKTAADYATNFLRGPSLDGTIYEPLQDRVQNAFYNAATVLGRAAAASGGDSDLAKAGALASTANMLDIFQNGKADTQQLAARAVRDPRADLKNKMVDLTYSDYFEKTLAQLATPLPGETSAYGTLFSKYLTPNGELSADYKSVTQDPKGKVTANINLSRLVQDIAADTARSESMGVKYDKRPEDILIQALRNPRNQLRYMQDLNKTSNFDVRALRQLVTGQREDKFFNQKTDFLVNNNNNIATAREIGKNRAAADKRAEIMGKATAQQILKSDPDVATSYPLMEFFHGLFNQTEPGK